MADPKPGQRYRHGWIRIGTEDGPERVIPHQHMGVSRKDMPQLAGAATAGTPSERIAGGAGKFADLRDHFEAQLKRDGIPVTHERVPVNSIRASQNEVNPVKVGGMADAVRAGDMRAVTSLDKPIYISSDSYVIDGHHKWAAGMLLDDGTGRQHINVRRVGMPIHQALDYTRAFADRMGIGRRSVDQMAGAGVPATEKGRRTVAADAYLDTAEQMTYWRVLTKSTNFTTREYAAEQLLRLEVAAADVVKVGPKGYSHGWIKVGPGEGAGIHARVASYHDALRAGDSKAAEGHLNHILGAAQSPDTLESARDARATLAARRAGQAGGWAHIGVHPSEGQAVHDHLNRWRNALNAHDTEAARGHLTSAFDAAEHPKTRQAIERHAAQHRYAPYDKAPGERRASRAAERDFLRASRANHREASRAAAGSAAD